MTTLTDTAPARRVPFGTFVPAAERAAAPIGRAMITSLFVLSALTKAQNYQATQGYMEAFGLPGALLPLVIAFELVVPLLLVAGPFVRLAALALAGFALVSGALFHADLADPNQVTHLLKNLAIAGGLLTIATRHRARD